MPAIGISKPKEQSVSSPLVIGGGVPQLPEVPSSGRYFVAFLRHVGCPFAENTVRFLREDAKAHSDVQCVVVTHGNKEVAAHWLDEIGGLGSLIWLHDAHRDIYGRWGVGYSKLSHFANFKAMTAVSRLRKVGIKNRDATGTRWQRSAWFYVEDGVLTWMAIPENASETPRLREVLVAES